jgi:hypothetical protein
MENRISPHWSRKMPEGGGGTDNAEAGARSASTGATPRARRAVPLHVDGPAPSPSRREVRRAPLIRVNRLR